MHYFNTLEFAKEQDALDMYFLLFEINFIFQKIKKGDEWLYFTGNSLGLTAKIYTKVHSARIRRLGQFRR